MINPTLNDRVLDLFSIGSVNRGNFRKVHEHTRCSRGRKKRSNREREREKEEERGEGGEKGLSETAAIYETEWKRVLEGGRRPPPLIPPLNTAISTSQLHSAIPHFKGKISVRTGRRLSLHRLFSTSSEITTARMENNATSCSWQLVPPLLGNFLANYRNSRRS